MNKLVLFDIDKTLIKSSKGHLETFRTGFNNVYGVDTGIDIINYHGMTDQQIIIEVLKMKGLDEVTIRAGLSDCMRVMSETFNRDLADEETVVLEGVPELLEELDRHRLIMGLVTGNLEPIARGKLIRAGLEGYFKVGGFGSDNVDRVELVRIAIRKSEEKFNFRPNNNIFLFGDAPQDMKAGKEAGVKTIGVTTGIYSKGQLVTAGADFVVEGLNDRQKILEIMEIVGVGLERKS